MPVLRETEDRMLGKPSYIAVFDLIGLVKSSWRNVESKTGHEDGNHGIFCFSINVYTRITHCLQQWSRAVEELFGRKSKRNREGAPISPRADFEVPLFRRHTYPFLLPRGARAYARRSRKALKLIPNYRRKRRAREDEDGRIGRTR